MPLGADVQPLLAAGDLHRAAGRGGGRAGDGARGGGGGGGWFGGGGGACQRGGTLQANGMGGGGSGYIRGAGVSNAQTSNGANSSANGTGGASGGRSDAQYASGIGDGGGTTGGGNGEVVIEWQTRVGLSIAKTADKARYVPGQPLTYTVVVRNSGPAPAVNAAVRDALPSALNGFTWTCAAGGAGSACGAASGTGSIDTTATVAAGDSVTYTVTGTVPSSTTGTLSNTATVTRPSASTDPNCGPTCSSTIDTPAQPTTGLSVTKTPDKNPYVPGQPLTYTIVVKNSGPSDATGVSVQDTLPASIQNFTWTCAATAGSSCGSPASGTGNIGTTVNILAGGQVTYTLTGTVPADASGSLDNRATVTPPGGATDPGCSPNCTSTSNPIPPGGQATLAISKALLTNPVVPGRQIQWRVTVSNSGPSRARNVVVSDRIPAGVTGATMTPDGGGTACTIANGTATCPAVEIPVGGSVSWTLSGTLDPNATATPSNTATVTGGPDPATPTRTAVASPTASPSPQASLSVSKALLTNPVVPGQQIQWRVSVTNNGPSRARNVVVSDAVPAGVTGASMTADSGGATCPIANGTATCPAVEISVGQTLTWTLTGTLDPNATATPTNTAIVTGGPDPATPTHTAVASPTASPSPRAELTVSKSLLTSPVVPGRQIQWRVTVTNNGPSRARNVVVTDAVPAGVTGASMTADVGGAACTIANGTATCPAVEIPVGGSVSWTLSGTLDPNAAGTPSNTATVTGGPDPATPTRTAVASPTASPSPQANLTVSKALLTNPVVPGQQIQWRVTVTNNGPSRARNVVVTDQIPARVTGASMTADTGGAACPIANGTATCPAVELAVGQSLSWTLSGTLASDATVTPTNSAVVTGGPDPATPTHTAVATPTASPSPQANLTVSKALLTNPVVPGQQIQWRVTVTNNGPSRARDVVVTDRIPAGVTGASMTADAGGAACPIANGTATCPAVELDAGQSLTWTLTGTLDANATVTPSNSVVVTGGPDPATPTHTAVATPTASPSPQASLVVSKVLVTNPVVPGQQIQWRVSVTNNGPSTARNVVVSDAVPAGVTGASMTADSGGAACPIANGTATCPAVEIPVGQTLTWTLTGTLDPNATATPTNTAIVTGGPDSATPTHTAVASSTATPSAQANLTVSKSLLTNPVVPGQQIQWRVTVTNNGPSRARDVVVSDQVPAGVTGASMTSDASGAPCPITNGTATCPAVELAVGQSLSWTLSGTLASDATVTPTNMAVVTGGPDPATPTHTAVATPTTTPSTQANLTVSKALVTNPVVPGQQIQWRVSVTNNGPSTARNVVVSDAVPAGVTGASMTADAGGAACPIANGTATCPAVEIPVGQTLTWTLTGTLDANATATPTNTAVVTGGPDPATPTHTAVATPTATPSTQANLTVSKALVTNPVVPGQQIQWQVTVTNNGPSRARDVVVTDQVPAGVTGASMTAADGTPCPIANGTATCPAVEIPVGQTLTWTLTGTLDPNATVTPTNTAIVTGGPDPATPTHTAVATPTTTPSTQASLTVAKALVTNPVVPGQQIQWQVTVTNNGPSRARDVVVTDQVPAGVTGASMTAADGTPCPITNGTATCPAVEVEVGQTLTWTLTGTLDANATTTPTNSVVVTGGPDPATPTHTAVATPTTTPAPQANLTVSKALVTNPVIPGQQIQWQVTVTNNGPSRARDVVVTDQVPAGVTGASMSAADGTPCPITNGTATCPAVEIEVGQTLTWTLTGTLDANATTTPTNSAVVTGGPDPATPTHTAVATPTSTPSAQANLTVSKALVTNPVIPGQQIQWQVTVTNNGPSRARDVVVSDQIPAGVTGASMAAADGTACPITNGTATCPAVEIEVGQTLTWTLTGTLDPNATTTPTNSATVTGGPDPTTPTHTAVATPTTTPSTQANLTVSKALVTNPVVPGQQIQWQVTVTNNGPSRARDVVVSDQVPAGVTGASMAAADGTPCPIANGTATCPAVEIEVGQTLTWTLMGTLDANATTTPTNSAIVTGGPDPATPTHTAVATPTTTPAPQANLTVAKTLVTNPVIPGQQIQWQVTVTNNGPSRARDVVVTDQVPAGVTGASMAAADGTPCPITNGTATCPAVEIEVGQTLTWTLTGTLDANATTTPTNSAVVTGGPDPATPTHTAVATPTSTPSAQASLTVSKALVTNPVVPGQQIQWRVSVTNNGPSRARDVVVTDTVPAGVLNPAMTADADSTPCPIANGTANCPAVEIEVGQTLTWTLTGTLDANATTTPTNSAVVTGGPDPATPTHTAVATPTSTPSAQASLTVSKALVTNPVVPGQQIQWRVSVTNNGPSRARDVIVSDQVPAGVTGASMTADADGTPCPITNGTATCPAVEIEVGQTLTWTLTGTLDANATVTPTNTAVVTGGPDPATPTHTSVATPTTTPSPQANLTVAKALVTNPVVPGQQIQWQVTVTNNGPSRARDVVVTDQVPAGVTGASMSAADGTPCPITNGTTTCPAVEIEVGQTLTWTLTGTLDANATTTPTNTAIVTGGPDPATPTHTAVATPTTTPSTQANLTVSKALLTNPVVPGQQIQWRVSVTNNGPSRARDVVVTDQVPAGVTGASMTADADSTPCPIANGTATCPAVEIEVGQTLTWTLTGTLDANATTTPTNSAVVTGGPDPATPTHTAVATPTTTPSTQASLTVSKALLTNPVVPGQQIQWRVSVTNNGPSRARDVVVTDQVPAGVTGTSMAADADSTPCPVANGTATCPAVKIEVGQTLTWTLTGTLDPNATATPTNTAVVTGGPDPATPTHTSVATPTTTPSPQANLTVSKALVTNPVVPGQQIQWRVSITNNGPSRARDVVVTDTVPAGVLNPAMAADADATPCPITSGTATCPAVEIPVGQTLTWTLTGTLDANATTTPENSAVVTGGPDPATPTHTAVATPTTTPSPQANLTVSKALVTSPVVPGQQIQWQVTVTNNGPSRARDVVVTDQVPAGVTGASMSAADGTPCPITNGTATCPAVEIEVGQTLTWTLTGTLDANATTTPTNTAIVTGGPDPATPTHTAVATPTSTPSGQASLTVAKTLLTNPVVPGQQIQWQVTVTNNGPSRARDVVVTDQVPAGVTGASMTAADGTPCLITNGTATCPAVEIEVGQTLTWTLTGTLDPNATVTPTNSAVVTGGPDPATPTHTTVATPTTTPSPQANLTVAKALLTNPVVPGQQIQWQVTVTNNGPSRARDVVVTDQVPTGVTGASMTAADGTPCPITNGTATCPAVEIPAGQTLTWTLTGTLDPNATVTPTNSAVVTGGPDPATPTHTTVATPTTTPSPQADLAISKVLLTDPVVPGRQIQWRVTVTNNGPSRARDVVVADTVPAGVLNPAMTADADGTPCPITNGTATCPAVEIPAGGTVSYTLTGTLDAAATGAPVNVASVTGGPDPDPSDNTATATPTGPVQPNARLTVSKVLLTDPVVPGQRIQWRVAVTDNGPSTARGVVLSDRIPAQVLGATVTVDATGAACPIADGTATCPAVDIAVGATATFTVAGTLDPAATSVPVNTATVTGGPDLATPTHTAVASPTVTPSPQAALTVSKVLLTSPVVAGAPIAWRVSVTNDGPSRARDVVVSDRFPRQLDAPVMTADADGSRCPAADGVATCPAIELAVGATATYTVSGTLSPDATEVPVNSALVTGGPDPATPTHAATATPSEPITVRHDLRLDKQVSPASPNPGDTVTYTVTATNLATGTYHGATVVDDFTGVLGAAAYAGDARATAGRVDYSRPLLTWTLDLRPGATETLTYTFTVGTGTGGQQLVNRVVSLGDGSNCPAASARSVRAARAAADGSAGGGSCTTSSTVNPPKPSPSPKPSPTGGPLPPTGSGGSGSAGLVAALALAAGGLLIALRRSRR
ncbi:hypothetical protein [Kitasatospora sp. NPDC093806]|uniref:DUF7927 domain-containing protein n=1 Tax=Kitasatospora sp. NPDC093806 TaxID=3155075 RepID=UPI00342E3989